MSEDSARTGVRNLTGVIPHEDATEPGDANLVAASDTCGLLTDAAWDEISGDTQNPMERI